MTAREKLLNTMAAEIAKRNFNAYRYDVGDPVDETLREIEVLKTTQPNVVFYPVRYIPNDLILWEGKVRLEELLYQLVQEAGSIARKYYDGMSTRAMDIFFRNAMEKSKIQFGIMMSAYNCDKVLPRDTNEQVVMDTISQSITKEGYYFPADAIKLSQDETFVSLYRVSVSSNSAGFYCKCDLNPEAVKRLIKRGALRIAGIDYGIFDHNPMGQLIERK